MSSLHQTNLYLSPTVPESVGSDDPDDDGMESSPTVIPRTPLKDRAGFRSGSSVGRRLLPVFSKSSTSRSRAQEVEDLAKQLPRWCQDSSCRDSSPTPSGSSSTTTLSGNSLSRSGTMRTPSSSSPGSSASTSDCKLLLGANYIISTQLQWV